MTKHPMHTLYPLILCTAFSALHMQGKEQPHIKLESKMLALVDGSFVNADTVEHIRIFQRDIINILWGDKGQGNAREARYLFDGKKFGAQQLATFEDELASMRDVLSPQEFADLHTQLNRCLLEMKKDMLESSNKLKTIAAGSKGTMGVLIEEDCEKRSNKNSVLFIWAKAKEEEEDVIFDRHVKTVRDFYTFSIDLLNFLGDLVYSCPRAVQQFEQRIQKWEKIKSIMPSLSISAQQEKEFLKHVKINHLDKLSLGDITPGKLKSLAAEFIHS